MVKCIFCDEVLTSSKRTKEHILPMWLLKATGDPNRLFRVGTDLVTASDWIRPASTFEFPACHACNQRYGKGLEAQGQKIVLAIMTGRSISVANAYRLLDWLDKVRIGLWRGFQLLHKEREFSPRFSIDTRLGRKDRIAIISTTSASPEKVLTFGGTDNNLFRLGQGGLFLRINNIQILSLSADYLLTKETGLPHGGYPYLVAGQPGVVGAELQLGNYALSQDWHDFSTLGGTILAQPIIDTRLIPPALAANLYTNSRVIEHAKDSMRISYPTNVSRIIQQQLITNTSGHFQYHQNKHARLKIGSSGMEDADFMRTLYALLLKRCLRNFPLKIRLSDGTFVDWLKGFQVALDCTFQLKARMAALGMPFVDEAIVLSEIQRIDRILEEQYASSEGTLVPSDPLVGSVI